uniref:Transposase n=1 Tax=Aromatoleum toluolicum TaxID=90060 RepID=A0ABX1NGM4_9RHOO|nr:transposase [Aromatoleum toluolicum]
MHWRRGSRCPAEIDDEGPHLRRCAGQSDSPIRLLLTASQVADVTQGAAFVDAIPTDAVIAVKGYNSDALVAAIESTGTEAIIPPHSNRNTQRNVDWLRYKARNLVAPLFNRLKQFRRLEPRNDKLANRFHAFLHLACAYRRLRKPLRREQHGSFLSVVKTCFVHVYSHRHSVI